MHKVKNKFLCLSVIMFIFMLIFPFFCYGVDENLFVWSEISSPIITTSSILSEGER